MKHKKNILFFLFFLITMFSSFPVQAALKTSDLETVPWNTVAETSMIDENGWLQSMCATDQYIVCLINGSKKTTEPDTLIAFYRNTTDASGNPVEQYSYAFHVTETDYEHGNGMTYNPNTQEIAIAGLFTNDPSNKAAVFIVDANTLKFKRKVTVGNGGLNYFGIDYVPENDQYVLMANRIADYAFIFTDGNFQITDKLNLKLSHSRSSFQDFIVSGDSIISIPYMQREGFMNILDVYSISKQQRVGSYYLTLPGHDSFDVEPEGICQLEDGHLLMASAIIGTHNFKLYEAYLPLVYSVTSSVENGTITESALEIPQGESHTVTYSCEEGYRLKSLTVDGQEINIQEHPDSYTFSDMQSDHTIHAAFEEIPRYTITTSGEHGTIDENPSALEHENLTVNYSPEEHYELTDLIVDGTSVELEANMTSYTFSDLTSDHTIEAVFTPIPAYTITIDAKNGIVEETQATVYRDESYTTKVKPEKYFTLTKYLLDGKKAPLEKKNGNITLKNIQSNHTITLIYERVWLQVLILICIFIAAITILFLLLHMRRMKKRRQRARELRKIRLENRYFFQTMDELEELENHLRENPEHESLAEETLEQLINDLKPDKKK